MAALLTTPLGLPPHRKEAEPGGLFADTAANFLYQLSEDRNFAAAAAARLDKIWRPAYPDREGEAR